MRTRRKINNVVVFLTADSAGRVAGTRPGKAFSHSRQSIVCRSRNSSSRRHQTRRIPAVSDATLTFSDASNLDANLYRESKQRVVEFADT